MRLYLSSFRIGLHAERLVSMAGGGKRALIIMNACDNLPPEVRNDKLHTEMDALDRLGFVARDLDLRRYFDNDSSRLERELRATELLWVRGGNVFVLMRAVRRSDCKHFCRGYLSKTVLSTEATAQGSTS